MLILKIIVASTRPERKGGAIARWYMEQAKKDKRFDIQLLDLCEIDLPLLDEPNHPRLRKYQHEHTKKWSAEIDEADAFIFVIPEYNYGSPPALLNALDYLFFEWHYKPVGFVSYGGVSGGLRSVEMTKGVVTALKMMPIVESVTVPFFMNFFNEAGEFEGSDVHENSVAAQLNELYLWAEALKGIREKKNQAAG
jgi:NAD(P)H-dependent FMN reductase